MDGEDGKSGLTAKVWGSVTGGQCGETVPASQGAAPRRDQTLTETHRTRDRGGITAAERRIYVSAVCLDLS